MPTSLMFLRNTKLRTAGALLTLLTLLAPAARADDLERQLLKQAPTIIKHLQDKGYQNVGVLKFRVKKGQDKLSDNVGDLNMTLADRLEIALVLANDLKKPVGIIRERATAASLKGANHLNSEGRKALFEARYPLAWGGQKVAADVFLTGVAVIDPGLKEATIAVLAFDKEGGELQKVTQFKTALDAQVLMDSGESFLLRGAFDDGQVEMAKKKAIDVAVDVKKKKEKFPLGDPAAPISLEVVYDGKPVPVEVRDGEAFVKEPKEGQKVVLVVRRKDASKTRYGVVLKVNGENTLYRGRQAAAHGYMWILEQDSAPLEVKGFTTGKDRGEEFRILSARESELAEMNYGADVGTISLVAFREGKPKPLDLAEDAEDLAALTRGVFPKKPSSNLAALRQQLRGSGPSTGRGLIVPGKEFKTETTQVKFEPYAVPVLSITVHYYKP